MAPGPAPPVFFAKQSNFHSSVIGDYNSYISDLSDPLLSISTPQGIYIINAKDATAIAHTLR